MKPRGIPAVMARLYIAMLDILLAQAIDADTERRVLWLRMRLHEAVTDERPSTLAA